MNDKLYWDNAYKFEFEAKVIRIMDGLPLGVVLDGTYFFPQGGGQPSDRGHLGSYQVIDVQEVDGQIVHYLDNRSGVAANIELGDDVKCKIDQDFRYQNMRSHTGAHVLFGAARKLFTTLGYAGFDIHGGGGSLYLRTDSPVTPKLMYRILDYANSAIVDSYAIGTYFVKPEEVSKIRGCVYNVELPKDNARIVEIEGWDIAVCSGTHLAHTIEIGPISIIDREAHKKGVTRLDYVVARAAVSEIMLDEQALGEVENILSSGRDRAAHEAERLIRTLKDQQKETSKLQELLAEYRINELLAKEEKLRNISIVVGTISDISQEILRPLVARRLKRQKQQILALVGNLGMTFIIAGHTDDVNIDLQKIVVDVAKIHGGSGGGSSHLMSAGGLKANADVVRIELFNQIQTEVNNGNN